jgi:hypothetical protein
MNPAPLHAAIVHVPLGLAVTLPVVALIVAFALWRGWLAPRAFALVVLLQALTVGAGFAALRTGSEDGERLEDTVGEAAVESHEEAAERFMAGAGFSLAIGMAGLFLLRRERALRWIAAGTAAATLVVAGLAVATGKAGGHLVYGTSGAAQVAGGEHDDD